MVNTITLPIDPPFVKYPELKVLFEECYELHGTLLQSGVAMLKASNNMIFNEDLFLWGIIQRSVSLNDGILSLFERWNFVAGFPLLRMQLDSLIRATYVARTGRGKEQVLEEWRNGCDFDKIKDPDNGKPLKDWFLKEKAKDIYPWIEDVYKELSGHVHFSLAHMQSTIASHSEEDQIAHIIISAAQEHFPEKKIKDALELLRLTQTHIVEIVKSWTQYKLEHYTIRPQG